MVTGQDFASDDGSGHTTIVPGDERVDELALDALEEDDGVRDA